MSNDKLNFNDSQKFPIDQRLQDEVCRIDLDQKEARMDGSLKTPTAVRARETKSLLEESISTIRQQQELIRYHAEVTAQWSTALQEKDEQIAELVEVIKNIKQGADYYMLDGFECAEDAYRYPGIVQTDCARALAKHQTQEEGK